MNTIIINKNDIRRNVSGEQRSSEALHRNGDAKDRCVGNDRKMLAFGNASAKQTIQKPSGRTIQHNLRRAIPTLFKVAKKIFAAILAIVAYILIFCEGNMSTISLALTKVAGITLAAFALIVDNYDPYKR